MRIKISEAAEPDLIEGHRFYERQSAGLGDYFVDSVLADIESLRLYAGIHAVHFGYHRLLARRFPFAIYYRMESDLIPGLCRLGLSSRSRMDTRQTDVAYGTDRYALSFDV